ncbi:DMT family transporter [Cytobacillus solani]|uniref:Multidrug resistance protein SMR n=1 Tax=Cytobacillus solani TaxID=1637975 RepID=A0A0Q3T1Y4_9BACI|nr:multidrug efflux SMR transporter [Cytobacillus solani]KOP77687.1 multidrug resistance protein SMR [Bacillus sp. FJAT-21945]KQL17517.1 multidrug resistance protein SMR [Cytobacillus solani]USK55374.1 multidrug efflux SMR transporter [Cytobacillus solani]
MGWLFVICAAVSEVIGVLGLKLYSQKKTIKNGIIYLGGFGASFAFLYTSFNYLQLSIAYAVWIGIGTAGAVLLNMVLFGESKNKLRIASVALIVIGVTGLKALS